MLFRKIAVILFGCIAWPLFAQDVASTKSVSVSISAISCDSPVGQINFRSQGKTVKWSVPIMTRSRVEKYSGPVRLSFFVVKSVNSEEQEVEVGAVTLPEDAPRILLLFYNNGNDTYSIVAIPDVDVKFPMGSLRFVNGARLPLAFKCGNSTFMLGRGDYKVVEPASDDEKAEMFCQVKFQRDGKWLTAASNLFVVDPNARRTVYVVQNPRGKGAFEIFSLPDDFSDKQAPAIESLPSGFPK